MGTMTEAMPATIRDDLVALLPPLLRSLEALGFIARHLHPPEFGEMMTAAGTPEAGLREVLPRLQSWTPEWSHLRAPLETASEAVIAAFDGLRNAPELPPDRGGGIGAVFRALRQFPKAQEALYPLAVRLPPLSRFFLDPASPEPELVARQARLAQPPRDGETGVIHGGGEPGARGAFSMYVPEDYDPGRPLPLVMALHGGSGNGRAFLWSWLREARSHGAIVVAPTATGQTWALMGDDVDTPNFARILADVRQRWNIDPKRLLLTGMSDGGTFSYVSGLEAGSPFTHLAPAAAAFHPMLAQMADADRIRDLPITLTHGARDWMFPVELARRAHEALSAAGARVTYREIEDLSHCYPREINADLLRWMHETHVPQG